MEMNGRIRWSFNVHKWIPSKDQFIKAMRCVQGEEKDRILRFVYKKDAKPALIGRLLLRKCVSQILQIPYNEVHFDRTEKGKPTLRSPTKLNTNLLFDYNISHQGDYCVLAADHKEKVGVDVMKIEYSGGRSLQEFFSLMTRQFTSSEWSFIKSPSSDQEQLARFIRLWCLKESYTKAEGVGISFDLKRISFTCQTPLLSIERVTNDTLIAVDGKCLSGWTFEESLIGDNHCLAVATYKNDIQHDHDSSFVELNYDELMENCSYINQVDDDYIWDKFNVKPLRS